MTHRLVRACAVLASLASFVAPAMASHDHSTHITTEEEFFKEAGIEPGMHLPGGTNLADFAETAESSTGKNETPGQIRSELADLKDVKFMNDFLSPKESAATARQIAAAEIRLAIAEKRQQRDLLRKQKKKAEAAALDAKIHELKGKLDAMQPAPKKTSFADFFKMDEDSH